MVDKFEHAILGAGAAGLSLALRLVDGTQREQSILIVEKEAKNINDRTWCFWTEAASPLEPIARHVWQRLRFISPTIDLSWELHPFRYVMLRGLDFYEHARAVLQKHAVTFVHGEGEVIDGETAATISVNGQVYTAEWAYDSRLRPADLIQGKGYTQLKQHFLGWEVETQEDVFDPQTVTLFDLRTPQRGGVTFFYTLPFSPRRALVEYTLFSEQVLPIEEYEIALRSHLDQLAPGGYRILESERGIIPMTDQPFPRRLGRRILAIGTRGGRVKASTGYAFARIQRDSERIAASLEREGHPFSIALDGWRERVQDAIMLDVLAHEPAAGTSILSAIFRRNPIQRVLNYLDGRSSVWDDLRIMSSHSPGPFLRAIGRKYGR
jgi:lycopene beta-cyclase